MNGQKEYVIAVARGARESIPASWVETIAAIEGVTTVTKSAFMAKVLATPDAIGEIGRRFGGDLLIEEPVERRPL